MEIAIVFALIGYVFLKNSNSWKYELVRLDGYPTNYFSALWQECCFSCWHI